MSDTAVILLVLGVVLAAGALISGIALLIHRYHRQPTPVPTVSPGPGGPVAQIPTRQISVVRSSLSWLALGRYAVRGTLWVRPDGIAYTRPLRGPKHHPYEHISVVESPDPARDTLLTIHLTNGWGIVALTGTPQGRHLALVELSRWVPIGTPAQPS